MNKNSVSRILLKFLCLIGLSCEHECEDGGTLEYREYTYNHEKDRCDSGTINADDLKQRIKYSCQILGIKEDEVLSEKKIKKNFHKCARTWHPDKNPKDKAKAEEEFKRINNANLFLKNYLLYKNEKINRETFEENIKGISF